MKLVRFGEMGNERPGLVDADGTIRDMSGIVPDYGPDSVSPALYEKLAGADLSSRPAAPAGARIGAPLCRIGHFIAIGLNYADHAAETGAPIPKEPIVFSKAPNSLSGPNDDVLIPRGAQKLDWEVELAVVIGKRCDYVDKNDALSHVFGYAVCNDVSERAYQAERGGQWIKGKSAPTFGPLGPFLVTADENRATSSPPARRRASASASSRQYSSATATPCIWELPASANSTRRSWRADPRPAPTSRAH